ncbi:MAG: hypothetical protein AABY13_03385, partial [Nanoarchaeota archaeon]
EGALQGDGAAAEPALGLCILVRHVARTAIKPNLFIALRSASRTTQRRSDDVGEKKDCTKDKGTEIFQDPQVKERVLDAWRRLPQRHVPLVERTDRTIPLPDCNEGFRSVRTTNNA